MLFALFILISYIVRQNITAIDSVVLKSYYTGIIAYPIIAIIDAVTIPVAIPIMPAISEIYGVLICFILTFIGWSIGIVISFYISRKYGMEAVKKFVSLRGIYDIEHLMPKKYIFGAIVVLRLFLPLDIGRYALGIFTKVKFRTYLTASIIGIIPSAIYLSYVGSLSLGFEILALALGLASVLVVSYIYSRISRSQV